MESSSMILDHLWIVGVEKRWMRCSDEECGGGGGEEEGGDLAMKIAKSPPLAMEIWQ